MAACDAKNSYSSNLQIYTGEPVSGILEKNQGKHLVLEHLEMSSHILNGIVFTYLYIYLVMAYLTGFLG